MPGRIRGSDVVDLLQDPLQNSDVDDSRAGQPAKSQEAIAEHAVHGEVACVLDRLFTAGNQIAEERRCEAFSSRPSFQFQFGLPAHSSSLCNRSSRERPRGRTPQNRLG
jgi:hypothetical protein